jgi:hypothetical protein
MNLLVFIALLNTSSVLAQQTAISVKVSSGSPILTMPLELEATVTNPPAGKTALDLAASTTDSFAIAQIKEIPTNAALPSIQNFQIRILPLNIGKIPIRLFWKTETPSGSFETQSSPLVLDVADRNLKNLKIYDIASPLQVWPLLWPWILAAILAALLFWAYHKFKRRPILAETAIILDTRPPHEIAKEELERLKASSLWKEAHYREFYFELSEILKRYFERRFNIPATKMTTFELYRQLKHAEIDPPVLTRFKNLFNRADLVKFAKVSPEEDWKDCDVDDAEALIASTQPREPLPLQTNQEIVR